MVDVLTATAYTVPTDAPESDGTLEWDSTTIVVVEVRAGDRTGLGYTYGDASIAAYVDSKLRDVVCGRDPLDVPAAWRAMADAVRNDGRRGIAAMAISAVDVALHDLRARLLGLPLATALGRYRDAVAVYGSGGFTSYDDDRLAEQLGGWARQGIPRVKMKVGRDPAADEHRLRVAREAIGEGVELYVDANGAYERAEALRWCDVFASHGVTYLEEPVSSDDLEGLALIRDRAPNGLAIAAGEYGWSLDHFRDMISCVDVQQADVTRCGGITELLRVGALCEAHHVPLSAHCAPAISAHACCAVERFAHVEYFHDHVRVESLLFDGTLEPDGGVLRPAGDRPGLGLELKRADAERYRAA